MDTTLELHNDIGCISRGQGKHMKPEQWDTYRDTIEDLYVKQGKKLKDVMDIMRVQHGCYAT